jgi:hypothetical protein
MTMLTAYFDDTGSHAGSVVQGFLGFVSTLDQWIRFEHDWKAVLSQSQFDLDYFHMKEFRSGKGKFAKFAGNTTLQRELFDKMQRVIRVRSLATVGIFVIREDFERVNVDYPLAEVVHSPMFVAGMFAFSQVLKWKGRYYPDAEIGFVMDAGIDGWGVLDDAFYKQHNRRMIHGEMKKTPPLQAADHAAWECQRLIVQNETGKITNRSDARGAYKALEERFGGDTWFVLDEKEIRRVIDESGRWPRR